MKNITSSQLNTTVLDLSPPFFFVVPLGHNFNNKYYNHKFRSRKALPNSGKRSYRERGAHSFTLRTLRSHSSLLMLCSEQLSCTADTVILLRLLTASADGNSASSKEAPSEDYGTTF